jgi:hypothetical protein
MIKDYLWRWVWMVLQFMTIQIRVYRMLRFIIVVISLKDNLIYLMCNIVV